MTNRLLRSPAIIARRSGIAVLFAAAITFSSLLDPASAQVELSIRMGDNVVRLPSAVSEIRAADVVQRLEWQCAQPGLEWAELSLSAGALRIPVRAIVVRIDPTRFRFAVHAANGAQRPNLWTVDSASSTAAFAVNAGQFKEAGAWGWVRIAGIDRGLPGSGRLAWGVAFDTAGAVHWVAPHQFAAARRNRTFTHAFQSYPMLLVNGQVPTQALDRTLVDQTHRDARLIMAETDEAALLFVLTRFDALGRTAERVPIGLTLPESIVLSRALGARHAIMLDGGISAQMFVQNRTEGRVWRGLRSVPLGLVAVPLNRELRRAERGNF